MRVWRDGLHCWDRGARLRERTALSGSRCAFLAGQTGPVGKGMRPDDADMRGQDRDARLAGQTGPVGKGMRPDDAALPNGVVLWRGD